MLNRAVLVWIILASIWGSTWLVIKLGLDAALPPFTLSWTRFVIAFAVLAAISATRLRHLPKKREDWWMILITGNMLFALNYSMVYWGETLISSALAAIVYTTLPLIGGIAAPFIVPDEPLSRQKVIGSVMGIGGVVLIFAEQLTGGSGTTLGVLAIFIAVVSTAISSLYVKKSLRHIDPVMLTTTQLGVALPPMILLGLYMEGSPFQYDWTAGTLGGVVYLAIMGSAVTFALLNWLYRHMDVTKTQLIPLASTLIAVFLGWAVRGETHGPRTLIGGVIILAGLVLAAKFRAPQKQAKAA